MSGRRKAEWCLIGLYIVNQKTAQDCAADVSYYYHGKSIRNRIQAWVSSNEILSLNIRPQILPDPKTALGQNCDLNDTGRLIKAIMG